jgi:hypothetical protein
VLVTGWSHPEEDKFNFDWYGKHLGFLHEQMENMENTVSSLVS